MYFYLSGVCVDSTANTSRFSTDIDETKLNEAKFLRHKGIETKRDKVRCDSKTNSMEKKQ